MNESNCNVKWLVVNTGFLFGLHTPPPPQKKKKKKNKGILFLFGFLNFDQKRLMKKKF